jgi:hypothetical protein
MLAVYIVSLVIGLILATANRTFQHDAGNQLLLVLGFGAFMVVGALIVAHRHTNAIGWLFSAIALLAITGKLASEYAIYAYATRPGSLPGATLAAWYSTWPWWLVLALALVFTPLLFPTGRLLSPRWRPVAWTLGLVLGLYVMARLLTAGPIDLGLTGCCTELWCCRERSGTGRLGVCVAGWKPSRLEWTMRAVEARGRSGACRRHASRPGAGWPIRAPR